MILMFSALNADRPLYKRDLLNVCCEPRGARITFGYKDNHISGDMLEGAVGAGQAARFIGTDRDVLVVFVEWVGNNDMAFHPARFARIVARKDQSHAHSFEMELGDFPRYAADQSDATTVSDFTAKVAAGVCPRPKDQLTQNPLLKSCYLSRTDATFPSDGDWIRLAQHLARLDPLMDVTFIAPVLEGDAFLPNHLFKGATQQDGRLTYNISGGTSRELILRMIPGHTVSAFIPKLEVSSPTVAAAGPFVRQESEGFEARYVLSFARSYEETQSMLTVGMPLDSNRQYVAPEHQALVRVKISSWRLWVIGGMLFAGQAIQALVPERKTAAGVVELITLPSTHIQVDPMNLKLVGLALTTLGLFLALRKLPKAE